MYNCFGFNYIENEIYIASIANEDYVKGVLETVHSITNIYNDYVIMQFTGLTDKNGKEIYEGDILDEYRYVVAFVDGADSAALGMPMGWYEQRDDFESYRQLEVGDVKEVIGNIHQHRYLLKEKN